VVSTNGGANWNLAAAQPQFSICEGASSGAMAKPIATTGSTDTFFNTAN